MLCRSHWLLVAIVSMVCYSTCVDAATKDSICAATSCPKDVSDDVRFYYSSNTKPNSTLFNARDKDNVTATFNLKPKAVFIIHGYLETAQYPSCELIRRQYVAGTQNINVVVVDWSFATKDSVRTARKNMEAVGKEIALLINVLINETIIDAKDVTLVGHSLGAHVMGIVGKNVKDLGQIFGLDPTMVILVRPEELRLSKICAKKVHVIHAYSYGESKALGDVDFYANGPKNRASCSAQTCTHGHAYEYFAESLNTKFPFVAKKCKDGQNPCKECVDGNATVGGRTVSSSITDGAYYFETNAYPPYALHGPLMKPEKFSVNVLRTVTNIYTYLRNLWQKITRH